MPPSSRAAFLLLFWGYFETRIEHLLRAAMRTLSAVLPARDARVAALAQAEPQAFVYVVIRQVTTKETDKAWEPWERHDPSQPVPSRGSRPIRMST